MPTIGDKLRAELTLPDWFEETVISCLRNSGRISFICDSNETCVSMEGFPLKYEPILVKWAKDNNVNYCFRPTLNGKRRVIEFTL